MRHLRAALAAAAFLLVVAGAVPVPASWPAGPAAVRAASPEPSAGSGDTRSAGEAPGFVGSPLVAIAVVIGLGALAVVSTITYVRLTGGPGGPGRGTDDQPAAAHR